MQVEDIRALAQEIDPARDPMLLGDRQQAIPLVALPRDREVPGHIGLRIRARKRTNQLRVAFSHDEIADREHQDLVVRHAQRTAGQGAIAGTIRYAVRYRLNRIARQSEPRDEMRGRVVGHADHVRARPERPPERDPAAADRLFLMARERKLAIQTIQADLARPTPAVGWENSESPGLLPRLEGQFDLVLMLAVIHHLILMEQIPIPAILSLCHRLTTRYLVVEWVPVEDPMYQSLMRGRDALYGGLSEADLLNACEGLFRTVYRQLLENGRVLFLFERV